MFKGLRKQDGLILDRNNDVIKQEVYTVYNKNMDEFSTVPMFVKSQKQAKALFVQFCHHGELGDLFFDKTHYELHHIGEVVYHHGEEGAGASLHCNSKNGKPDLVPRISMYGVQVPPRPPKEIVDETK